MLFLENYVIQVKKNATDFEEISVIHYVPMIIWCRFILYWYINFQWQIRSIKLQRLLEWQLLCRYQVHVDKINFSKFAHVLHFFYTCTCIRIPNKYCIKLEIKKENKTSRIIFSSIHNIIPTIKSQKNMNHSCSKPSKQIYINKPNNKNMFGFASTQNDNILSHSCMDFVV